ncbi:acetate kinase [Streptoalloteichus tenebrarius]|uniref:Acetate kinase n=1 Tax=Streptoalloteichus tenebrarius (strain ATCC 17920 / DSM 40477 / JCM 4838 / CBS 697.72 / NBRC 16177 / NCIMB 11028 / NRRL B-12390 / A12253. 1 / ISP 5477) TaxID=1933 RepID=A0ABT1I240_STRSD|nr:acetate/propionate family kinase [Streptoalloteichus tenebrarius]MCP2261841.1 acetate kinase [Streptoalloteichus tenebrarius]BFE99986.1 acetate/propionate family kinase [Streptoalloteichus tenebrarius]
MAVDLMTRTSAVLSVNGGSSSLQLHLVRVDGEDPDAPETVIAEHAVDHAPDTPPATKALHDFVRCSGMVSIRAVGHRLVHGGPWLRRPTLVDDHALAAARRAASLAPVHVPSALRLLGTTRTLLPDTPHVLCPDTAFHAGLPEAASTYALPLAWRSRFGLRRFGFHGLSYAWALRRAAKLLGRPVTELQLLLTHLGGGCSVCAVRDGRSVDTSMGFTPLEGVPMTKRSGSVDPGMLLWLLEEGGLTPSELSEGLYRRSGLLGLSAGRSADTRELVPAAASGDSASRLALDVFAHRVRGELAAAATSLDRIDALVFTGEIGWDQPEVREAVCAGLGLLGVRGGLAGNRKDDGPISPPGAAVPVLVVRPREELQIARDTWSALPSERDPSGVVGHRATT